MKKKIFIIACFLCGCTLLTAGYLNARNSETDFLKSNAKALRGSPEFYGCKYMEREECSVPVISPDGGYTATFTNHTYDIPA